jgi:hypothetical protein
MLTDHEGFSAALSRDLDFTVKRDILTLFQWNFKEVVERMNTSRSQLLHIYHQIRKNYIFFDPQELIAVPVDLPDKIPGSTKASVQTRAHISLLHAKFPELSDDLATQMKTPVESDSAKKRRSRTLDSLKKVPDPLDQAWKRYSSKWKQLEAEKKHSLLEDKNGRDEEPSDTSILQTSLQESMEHQNLIKLNVREEIIRLSLRNLGPRGSYFHRLSVLIEYMSSFHAIVEEFQDESTTSYTFTDYLRHYYQGISFFLFIISFQPLIDIL